MSSKALTLLVTAGLLMAGAASLGAQTLGDVAKKEEERRKATPAGKVYTNKDLLAVPPVDVPPDKEAADKASAKPDGTAEKADADKKDKAQDPTKDQKYWRDRMEGARVALDRDTGYAEAMQTRINALTTDFVNRDDPAQRSVIEKDRQKALAELARLKKQVEDDKKAISGIEEEARRAGVPPGWLR